MSFDALCAHPVLGNDDEVQGTHVDDGYAGCQYSNPSLPSGDNGFCQHIMPTNDAGGYQNYQGAGSSISPLPGPVVNQYPLQIDPVDLGDIQYAPQSEANPFSPSLPEDGIEEAQAGYSPGSHYQRQPYYLGAPAPPTPDYGRESNDFNDHRMGNFQHQDITPCASRGSAAHGSTPGHPNTLYNMQRYCQYQYCHGQLCNNRHIFLDQQQSSHAISVPMGQRSEPEAPWSSVNRHQGYEQTLAIYTFRGDDDQRSNVLSHQGLAQLSQSDQSFGQGSATSQYSFHAPRDSRLQCSHVQTGLMNATDATPTHQSAHLSVPTRRTSRSSRRSSIVSGGSVDSIQCPSCNVVFSGVHGKGNWGRHNRHKHNGESKVFSCEKGCSKTFQRKDALLKHNRRCHGL